MLPNFILTTLANLRVATFILLACHSHGFIESTRISLVRTAVYTRTSEYHKQFFN